MCSSDLHEIETMRKQLKRQRRKQIIAQRRIDPVLAVERGTWYFLQHTSLVQMLYCLKRMNDPCCEHIGNNFTPVNHQYATEFLSYRNEIEQLLQRVISQGAASNQTDSRSMDELVRNDAAAVQHKLSDYRKRIISDIHTQSLNIESMTVFLNLIQESQELLSALRHSIRGRNRFME